MSDNQQPGLYLCKVKLKYTTHMVLRYDGEFWLQYMAPGFFPGCEGWIGVDFEFEPIKLIE